MIAARHHVRALERFEEHRRAWKNNEALRTLYRQWYGRIAENLPPAAAGPHIEIGSGPGFSRSFIPGLQLSDVVQAPWHDHQISAERLPLADASVGALVLFDVLHHLSSPAAFFAEAARVLVDGGRVVMCEPYISPLSYLVYGLWHPEPANLRVDPLADQVVDPSGKDPFYGNQAIPTLIFARKAGLARFQAQFPTLVVQSVERLAGLSHPASGGFGRSPLLPLALWRILHGLERPLWSWVYRLIGFRLLVVLENRR